MLTSNTIFYSIDYSFLSTVNYSVFFCYIVIIQFSWLFPPSIYFNWNNVERMLKVVYRYDKILQLIFGFYGGWLLVAGSKNILETSCDWVEELYNIGKALLSH